MKRIIGYAVVTAVIAMAGLLAWAQVNPGLFVFERGRPIVADEVNHNFARLEAEAAAARAAADGLGGGLGALEERVDALEATDAVPGPQGEPGPMGPQGEPGPMGPQGEPGADGPAGATGETGAIGAQGIQGEQGEQGLQGEPGAPGSRGEQGLQGLKGDIGDQGPQGQQGLQGETGVQGEAGLPGPQGLKGDTGDQGPQGVQGPQGPEGPAGPDRLDSFFGGGGGVAAGRGGECTMGEVWLTAGSVASSVPANGQILPINQNQALFSLLGTTYGGDGRTTFALPDLRDVAPKSRGGPALSYVICIVGIYPSRY